MNPGIQKMDASITAGNWTAIPDTCSYLVFLKLPFPSQLPPFSFLKSDLVYWKGAVTESQGMMERENFYMMLLTPLE